MAELFKRCLRKIGKVDGGILMKQAVLVVMTLTMLTVGCSGDATKSVIVEAPSQNDESDVGIPFLKSELQAISEGKVSAIAEDKVRVRELIECGRTRAKANKLTLEEALVLARLAASSNLADESGEFFRQALSLNRAEEPMVTILIDMAKMYDNLRKYEAAIEVYREISASRLLTEAGREWVFSSLAVALANNYQTEESLQIIQSEVDLDEKNSSNRFYEAWIYRHARRWDEAIEKFEQLVKDFPDKKEINLLAQFSLSGIYVQMGELRRGEEILEKVFEVDPDNTQVNNDLGYLWADQGKNLEHAEAMIRKALAAEPNNDSYLDSLGWVLFKLGHFDEAVPLLQQATQKGSGSSNGTVWDHLGDAFLKARNTEKAVEAWQTAVRHSEEEPLPDSQFIQRVKEKLKQHAAPSNPDERPKDESP